jgi:hypothetical protein
VGTFGEGIPDAASEEILKPFHPGSAGWPADEKPMTHCGLMDCWIVEAARSGCLAICNPSIHESIYPFIHS